MKLIIWTWKTSGAHERADLAILKAMELGEGIWEDHPISCSRSQLKRLIEEGNVTFKIELGDPSTSVPIRANQKLREEMEIQIIFPPPKEIGVKAEDLPIDILYEDEHLVVVNKPPALTVHPSSTQADGTLVNALLHHIDDLSGIGGELRPGIVHRIDKDTSGALVVSKTDVCHRRLVEIFSEHAIERTYWALTYGSPAGQIGGKPCRIETQIGRNPKDRKKMTNLESGGKKAVSYYKKIEDYSVSSRPRPFASFLEVTLETGRTHQVRVHLTSIGHSLLGDPVYGTPTNTQPKWTQLPQSIQEAIHLLPGQALHARILGFKHPITGQALRFEAAPPEGFQNLLTQLREYIQVL